MPSNHLILCRPLLLLPSIFPSIRVFSNELALHIRWPKYWSFSISPSNDYSGLISFRIDWLDLLAVQGTLKSLLQHCCLKASILQCSAFFMGQLSHPYMTTGKTITLALTFTGKVMSLLFINNTLSRFDIAFFQGASWNFRAVITIHSDIGVQENKISLLLPFSCQFARSDGTKCHDLSFFNVEFQDSFFTLLLYSHQEAL